MNLTMKIFILLFYFCITILNAEESVQTEETSTELCSNGTEDSCLAFNNTELSTGPEIEDVTSTTVSSKKPKTTTPKSTTKKPSPSSNTSTAKPTPHPDCACDETRGGCEVNCCCDVDCNSEQRTVFTHCVSMPPVVDSDYCFPPQLLHHNNTDYKTVLTEPGVLCVLHQNTLATTDFLDVPVIKTVASLERKLGQHRYYSWPNPVPPTPLFDVDTSYGRGSPLWISDNSTINPLVLPAPVGYSTVCHSSVMPMYLEEIVTSCTRPLSTKSDCLALSEPTFTVVSSPRNFNFTQIQECTEDICLPVHSIICSKSCTERIRPQTTFNDTSGTCQNVIVSLEYKIYHNGSQSIVDVKAFYTLRNITVHDEHLFRRQYKVSYVWAGSTDQPVLRRSGRPGYHSGKPVISGLRISKTVALNSSAEDWINVGSSGSTGYCLNRHSLLFGENLKTQCLLDVNGTCKEIQQQIWKQMLGPAANLSVAVISSYGDPRVEEAEAWVPVLMAELPPLPALVIAVDIVLVYSLVGPTASPQAKIIAAYLDLLPSVVTCDSNYSTLVIETSVKFIDKTSPAVTKFAQPPVYEIKLPQDFFYPFLSSGDRNDFSKVFLFTVVLVVLK